MKTLMIMRGLPGSGKSTFARNYQDELRGAGYRCVVLSTDDIQQAANGKYIFEPDMLGVFHETNYYLATLCMKKGVDCIIIDNTNIKKRDYGDYVNMANLHGYKVEEMVIGKFDEESIKQYHSRNRHNVPLATIVRMAENFQP